MKSAIPDLEKELLFDLGSFYWIDTHRLIYHPRFGGRFGDFGNYRLDFSDGSHAADGSLKWDTAVNRKQPRNKWIPFEGNRFERNFTDVAVSHPVAARGHLWRGNHWDSYQGFDRDGDGVGDYPHQVFLYADRIWMDRPLTRFFRASLALELIDFLERLAPFSTPEPVLVDPLPRVD